MKKLYPLLSVLFLIYWGCEDNKNDNNDDNNNSDEQEEEVDFCYNSLDNNHNQQKR